MLRKLVRHLMDQPFFVSIVILVISFKPGRPDDLPTCLPKDFHYEYTQCDSDGGRWRVSVPKPNTCVGGAPNPPIRGKGCDFTCNPGEYLDIAVDQECRSCPVGHYSLGGGVRYDDWENLPTGFSVQVENFNNQMLNPFYSGDVLPSEKFNCTGAGWIPRNKYLASDVVNCTAALVYTANLVRPGLVSFSYEYEDENVLFTFEVQNSRCETLNDKLKNRYLKRTVEGSFASERFDLKTGVNVLIWRVLVPAVSSSRMRKPVLIHTIDIAGVAYTSECTVCKPGTYSGEGSISCRDCPANTYSGKGAAKCITCNVDTEYSEPGSANCKPKVACTETDYYEYQTACDKDNKTRTTYQWTEPKLCRDDLPDSVALPADGEIEDCPPCNPGMEPTNNGSCRFCPANHFSDGSNPCQPCPGSTAPEAHIVYKWWNNLPQNSGISSSCVLENGQSCFSKTGWNLASNYAYSSKGQADDAFLLLNLHVNGFRGKEQFADGKQIPVGKVSFTFETTCSEECSFLFMQRTAKDGMLILESWSGSHEKSRYIYEVTNTAPVSFIWAFQKRSSEAESKAETTGSHSLREDVARIHYIEVTNTRTGGADSCKVCPKGASIDGCIPCPEGQYVDVDSTQCKPCPADKVVRGYNAWGIESCSRCGPGLVPKQGSHCVTTCRFNSSRFLGHEYNFQPLAGIQSIEGIRLFTTSGYKYYRMFHLSLCSSGATDSSYPLATCFNNATSDVQSNDTSNIVVLNYNAGKADETDEVVQSPVCRSTILPSAGEDSKQTPVSVQPISLSDVLVAITENGEDYNITMWKQKAGFLTNTKDTALDVHFVYVSDQFTSVCRHGRMTIVTMRCDAQQSGNGSIELPSHCPDGTCDGCVYLFLWRSQHACPLCRKENYVELAEECRDGKQKIIRIKPKDCYSSDGADTEVVRIESCSILWQPFWPIWLKVIVVLVPVILGLGIILFIVVLHCWLKNKKLQYKYMKLIESTSGKDGELPAAETCALDEGEEDDQFDATVEFKQKGRKLFGKLKHSVKKDKSYDEFHDVSTDHSSLLG